MNQETDYPEFVEVDPTGRYGRYNEILGKGASKIVYRAFDEYEGIEVAWNQVKLYDFLRSPEDLERLYCEIHLLKTLKHKNIMKFYTSWVDTSKRNINFVTELFTSGTLRQYRQKHRRVNIRAVKQWCRQILEGLLYLHGHDPPVIHRDLKCDNIFINGNQGEVKIGDLGLAAILRKSHAAHCVGTPEFMAPEVYEEEYNELVDIYSFGMCVLEMVTFEYPYSECTHPAQIYKKVVSGTKPDVLYRVKDPEVKHFVEKCLATASKRLSARELLKDPFLQLDDHAPVCTERDAREVDLLCRQPSLDLFSSNGFLNGYIGEFPHHKEIDNWWDYDTADISTHGMDLFNSHEDELVASVDITIKGRRKEDGGIFLRLRIADKDGRIRNIYFPFDIETDTALSVATEMVAELDIIDYEVTRIAEMIDNEVSSLVPEWEPGPCISETPRFPPSGACGNCKSNVSSCGSLLDYLSKTPGFGNIQSVHCLECAAMHGRFGEVTYQVDESEEQCVMEGAPGNSTSQSDEDFDAHDEKVVQTNGSRYGRMRKSIGDLDTNFDMRQYLGTPELEGYQHSHTNLSDDYENEVRLELSWFKAKCQMEQRDYKNRQLGGSRRVLHPSLDFQNRDCRLESEIQDCSSPENAQLPIFDENMTKTLHADRISGDQRVRGSDERSPEFFTAKKFIANEPLLPNCLNRTKSLPVDALDV